MRIGVYLVDMLDEAHGYTFIADAYSGNSGKQPGLIDVKIGIIGINDMFFFLHLIMHVTFGPIVLSCFTLICFFRFYLLPLFFEYGRLGSLLLFGCVGYKFGESLSKALLLAKRFAFLKECLFKGRNLLYQSIYLVQESVVVIS